jgi:hypothetical protein
VANTFYASIDHEAHKDVNEALEAGDIKNALCLLSCLIKQQPNNNYFGYFKNYLLFHWLFGTTVS